MINDSMDYQMKDIPSPTVNSTPSNFEISVPSSRQASYLTEQKQKQ